MATPGSATRTALALASLGVASVVTGCSGTPAQHPKPDTAFLDMVAEQIGLPERVWTASGTHTAKGYTGKDTQATSVEGMKADCDNINLNKKLAGDFRSDVFGPGMKGFFYKCQKVAPDTNKYWFTISAADQSQVDTMCDPATAYPVVYDEQHNTYWIDEPFTCTDRSGPS